ncbi:polysaccharide pyruvyl transferase family protein [Acinetobacter pittii]|uniref:polysaccharide pyruvyl transferase family protein n=1 Tax=Acinetobacter pittii TaxID=48296 RepID=UPI001F441253|nr:polysaccharide pyruvyl transferase family protein [Acinetobacter pittii]MCE6237791.1 polysaccharide pyruvyl transferase family protein [Acinetobacter pittii]MCE6692648.1 polysaccharide pyruvyl transferase family protein [Acinetobacter pittii]MCE6700044.1 polysaccharide pyruvyl transferase family protein [Acinetobacter pittii]MCU4527722.1 polysaccharide pyruvyl transferase family protein [Acinetobacter pittii]
MNAKDLKRYLQSIIESKLSPLVDSNYVYWDLPYHINIGDTLIWQGTLDFLSDKPYEMLNYGNSVTASLDTLSVDTVILLHGGGNFGDIYGSSQKFRKDVVEKYPNNKIIILPQTIYFKDKNIEREDFQCFAQHKNLYLCVRDQSSYNLACQYLEQEKVLFLPDMAFCIKDERLVKSKSTGKKLLMSRIDVEAVPVDRKYRNQVSLQSDWPTFEKTPIYCNYLKFLFVINRKLSKGQRNKQYPFLIKYINNFAMNTVRTQLIDTGIRFINDFDVVYTTRLHGCILSLLLDKKIILLDNSYGKNRAYHEAWLTGSTNIEVESC